MNETEFITELLDSININIDDETLKKAIYKDLISLIIEFSPEALQEIIELDPIFEEEYRLFVEENWEQSEEDEEDEEDI